MAGKIDNGIGFSYHFRYILSAAQKASQLDETPQHEKEYKQLKFKFIRFSSCQRSNSKTVQNKKKQTRHTVKL